MEYVFAVQVGCKTSYIDATDPNSGLARYINCSDRTAEPNIKQHSRKSPTRGIMVSFFATRNIGSGEELRYAYGGEAPWREISRKRQVLEWYEDDSEDELVKFMSLVKKFKSSLCVSETNDPRPRTTSHDLVKIVITPKNEDFPKSSKQPSGIAGKVAPAAASSMGSTGLTWVEAPKVKPRPKATMNSAQILAHFGLTEESFKKLQRRVPPTITYKTLTANDLTVRGKIPANYRRVGRYSPDGKTWSLMLMEENAFNENQDTLSNGDSKY
jgi:hypothetical protein